MSSPIRPEAWVPVDRRWLGLDRRTIGPSLVVVVLAVLLAVVIPAVDQAIPDGDTAVAGDRLGLDGGIRFTPAAGWNIVSGIEVGQAGRSGTYPSSAEVTNGPVALSVATAKWSGTPAELLAATQRTTDAMNDDSGPHLTGKTSVVTTTEGDRGLLARYRSTTADGAVVVFVIHGTGVRMVLSGPKDVPGDPSADLGAMITSVAYAPEGA